MSADNWRRCPQCLKTAKDKQDKLKLKAGESYGKVPKDEYLKMLKDAETEPQIEETFREDYELGTDEDGNLYVSYHGGCNVCSYAHSFKHEQAYPPK